MPVGMLANDEIPYHAAEDHPCEYMKADAQLNTLWANIRTSYRQNGISEARYNALVRAQQAWIPLCDAECKLEIPRPRT